MGSTGGVKGILAFTVGKLGGGQQYLFLGGKPNFKKGREVSGVPPAQNSE